LQIQQATQFGIQPGINPILEQVNGDREDLFPRYGSEHPVAWPHESPNDGDVTLMPEGRKGLVLPCCTRCFGLRASA
jgi:hypothetical protein